MRGWVWGKHCVCEVALCSDESTSCERLLRVLVKALREEGVEDYGESIANERLLRNLTKASRGGGC